MTPAQTLGRPVAGAGQIVAYTGTAGTSTALAQDVLVVRVLTTTDAYIQIGLSPTATTADCLLPAMTPEYFSCQPGSKVSAIQLSSGGNLHVTPMV